MTRKQRKSLPWRRFGYVILIIIKFGEVLLWFSPRIMNALRSYIKHSKECFIRYPNTSKLVKKTRLRLVFSTHFSVFGYLMKHSSSCLIYYFKHEKTAKSTRPMAKCFHCLWVWKNPCERDGARVLKWFWRLDLIRFCIGFVDWFQTLFSYLNIKLSRCMWLKYGHTIGLST